MRHTLKWFENRIGKRIYRLTETNCCETCQEVYKNGMVIRNKFHAYNTYIHQNELNLEYGDKKGR